MQETYLLLLTFGYGFFLQTVGPLGVAGQRRLLAIADVALGLAARRQQLHLLLLEMDL